eukprot:gene19455-biopygen28498
MDGLDSTLSAAEFVVALRYRLGLPQVDAAGFCGLCGEVLDIYGDARWQPHKEKPGLLPPAPDSPDPNRRRPADVYLPAQGAVDFAVTCPNRPHIQYTAAREPLAAAQWYEDHKRGYLDTAADCVRQGFEFNPAVFETTGARAPTISRLLQELARARATRRGETPADVARRQHEALSVSIRRSNA